ncbi:vacuolar protein sorting-associated protein 26 family protein [Heterostelium album PN500]|uniref:Vacuolar protein sorting-associated protein 26C n=1 Tax=Heterostelium pallidum (strain ATCC 26659 / Pp 5 / PN500) TaxID=670386 RepID=D3B6Y4_HETP5|nr:vacuolar protein sorting-associated protein 26 family protein [Heterostelium album PN500]EFA82527.1 vacuolar protein sorting-associated protein 26 family protein [Heterostelium album PN500]|eukprot:XP_020434644.1 vacuolar protein sorting-associated protein 26 family protein [Heterostelium album PN500]
MSAANALDIKLKKIDKIYKPGNKVAGYVVVSTKEDLSHSGLTLTVEGSVQLQLSSKSVGIFEAFYNSLKPITMLHYTFNVAPSDGMTIIYTTSGVTEIPFEFNLEPAAGQQLYDTYHGVFVNIQYTIKCDMKRGILSKDLQKTIEFVVETPTPTSLINKESAPVNFLVTPDSLSTFKKISKSDIPNFRVSGQLKSAICHINDAFQGHLIIESAEAIIKSVELQLVRVETCGCADGYARELTEIQNIQIGDGDMCRGLNIPIWMVFPRLFTCITTAARTFKIEFEVNLVIMLEDGHLITENFPIKLIRN